jgi:prepilin-type N-terminal cleavage/methylation domain-containing protein
MNDARRGFSTIELMIVVSLLGLLAAVAIPRIADPPGADHEAELVTALAALRTGVDSYWAQHQAFPGQGSVLEFTGQLCRMTNSGGRPGAGEGFEFGPYLCPGRIPMNPILGNNTVLIVDEMPTHPVGAEAWVYARNTGEIRPNVRGRSPRGRRYFDF